MSENILVVQITDCHLPADPKREYRGINPRRNLKKLMQKVKAMKPDLLLASGDLSEDGSRVSYQVLQKYLNLPGVPVLALPGNHDDVDLLAETFPGSPIDSITVSGHGPWQFIRLNSSLPGKPEGRIGEKALAELDSLLTHHEQRLRLIALHHHPISVGNPWIDKYPLVNPQALLRLIDDNRSVKAVLWGHIHHVFEADRNGTAMLGGPSSAINSLPGVQKFTKDPAGPACRWLELRADGTVQTGIIRGSER